MITVFYDGACSVCSKEIGYYQKLATESEINWVDLSQQQDPKLSLALKQADITREQALYELHVLDNKATLYGGVGAFQIIWQQFRYWRWLSALVGLPIIHGLVAFGYRQFIKSRVAKGQCTLPDHPSRARDAV